MDTPKFKRFAEGDYEVEAGGSRFVLYRLRDVNPPAWNVEEILPDGPGTFETCVRIRVDGAASKRDALALFADWWKENH